MNFGRISWTLATRVVMDDGVICRKSGLIYRKKIKLSDIEKVVAISRDAVTHDEIVVWLFDQLGPRVWLSEFDLGFGELMVELTGLLPGMASVDDLPRQQPFEKTEITLWDRRRTAR